jgi:arsenate reductase
MAEAFFNRMAKGKAVALSAGTQPVSEINPVVTEVMHELGIDVSNQKPKLLTLEMLKDTTRVITMGCSVEGVCPASFVPTEDWELGDPEGKPIEKVRQIRDEIGAKVEALIREL